MSKSMWIDAIDSKPVRSSEEPNASERVLIWMEGDESARFATYYYQINHWVCESARGFDQSQVKYFAYIDNPYK
jgi:hypothetical protein